MDYGYKLSPEEAKAFLRDLLAVCVKHGFGFGSHEEISIGRLTLDDRWLYIDATDSLSFYGPTDEYETVACKKNLAVLDVTTSAHGRLAATSQVASLFDQG